MSQIHKGIFGTVAIALMLGVAQFAFGHDLMAGKPGAHTASGTGINRAAKTDRAAAPPVRGQSETIVLRLDGLTDVSVLVRVPVAKAARNEARDRQAPPSMTRPGTRKTALACEPVVSVLTEVAKLLEPGRCVT